MIKINKNDRECGPSISQEQSTLIDIYVKDYECATSSEDKEVIIKELSVYIKKHNLFIVEDACHAITATYKGRPAGTYGDLGCFSLHPLKNLNVWGDGGLIVTNNTD